MMTRLFASALLVAGLSQAALAQTSAEQNQSSTSAENTPAPQNLPQSLRQKLTSSGFTDVNVVPSSFLITAKDKNGRPVMMRITPRSMFFLTEIPVVRASTTGTGRENSNGMPNANPGQNPNENPSQSPNENPSENPSQIPNGNPSGSGPSR